MKTSLNNQNCLLAIDAGGTSIKGALVSFGYRVTNFFEVPIAQEKSADEILSAFKKAGAEGAAAAKSQGLIIRGIGVCIPGPFDYAGGISLMDHKYKAIKGIPLRPFLQGDMLGLPVHFMHDSSAFLLGELSLHPEKNEKNICSVMIGTGLGFACTINGILFENENGGPGISIFRLPYQNLIVEDFVSKRGILRGYRLLGGKEELTVKDVAILAQKGDQIARKAFYQTGCILAETIAPILRENQFTSMILGGQIAKADSLLTQPLKETFDQFGIVCKVEKAAQIDYAPLIGAVWWLYEKHLSFACK